MIWSIFLVALGIVIIPLIYVSIGASHAWSGFTPIDNGVAKGYSLTRPSPLYAFIGICVWLLGAAILFLWADKAAGWLVAFFTLFISGFIDFVLHKCFSHGISLAERHMNEIKLRLCRS